MGQSEGGVGPSIKLPGIACQQFGQNFCHGMVVSRYGSRYSKICNHGLVELMRTPNNFDGAKSCLVGGTNFCDNDKVSENTAVEEVCQNGIVYFVNKITGRSFPKSPNSIDDIGAGLGLVDVISDSRRPKRNFRRQ